LNHKVALIIGITGQDGAYLAEFLLDKGYVVHGIKRCTSLFNTDHIDHLQGLHEPNRRFILHHGDLTDSSSLIRIIQQVQPDEIYNLAAQSHVAFSFEEPEYTAKGEPNPPKRQGVANDIRACLCGGSAFVGAASLPRSNPKPHRPEGGPSATPPL